MLGDNLILYTIGMIWNEPDMEYVGWRPRERGMAGKEARDNFEQIL